VGVSVSLAIWRSEVSRWVRTPEEYLARVGTWEVVFFVDACCKSESAGRGNGTDK
jgi:hypothetical protein